ncbi:hypothetical protein [Streptomyces sp. NPDC007991]|uniref:hypothetical protein n=1 Tax=Streptomyces sp. NPDC007991 TaxID=3364803 RepID=UPI0036EBC6AF
MLGKVFAALRTEGTRPADVAGELHLRPADLNDLIFGLVVTTQEGVGNGTAVGTTGRSCLWSADMSSSTRTPHRELPLA